MAKIIGEARRLLTGIVAAEVDECIKGVNSTNAFAGIGTGDDKLRRSIDDAFVKLREDLRRELCVELV
jgi:hypothetical protein